MLRSSSGDGGALSPPQLSSGRGSIAHINVRPVTTARSPGPTAFPFGISPLWHTQLAFLGITLACCGGVVGLSRLLPQLAEETFQQKSHSAVLLFIVTFGLFKAVFNLMVGALANTYGRRWLLLCGWCLSFGAPFLIWIALEWSLAWSWVLVATAILGASQGLCTSTAVVMVMDIVPARARGVSMGALECTIYVSLGLCALLASEIYVAFDFRLVLVVHFALCFVGLLAARATKETQGMALDDKAAQDDKQAADDDTNLEMQDLLSDAQPPAGWHLVEDADMAPSNSNSNLAPPTLGLGMGMARGSPGRKALALTMTSILPTLALHTIPASPLEGILDSAPPTPHTQPLRLALPGMLRSQSAGALSVELSVAGGNSPMAPPTPSPTPPSPSRGPDREPLLQFPSSPPLAPLSLALSLSSSTLGHVAAHAPSWDDDSFLGSVRLALIRVFSSRILRALLQAGFANNFKDGVCWGLLPSFFAAQEHRAPATQIGYLLTVFPLTWGLAQLVTGRLSDRLGRVTFISAGLALQGLAVFGLVLAPEAVSLVVGSDLAQTDAMAMSARFVLWLAMLVALGLGTALSYPVLQAYIGDSVAPVDRAATIGVYRLCRDLGYAVGGLLSGAVADRAGVESALIMLAGILLASATWAHTSLPPDVVEHATVNRNKKLARQANHRAP